MDITRTKTFEDRANKIEITDSDSDIQSARKRLDILLSDNAEYAYQKEIFHSDKEKVEAEIMKKPLSVESAFSYFGLMLGTFAPAAFFIKFLAESGFPRSEELWIISLMILVNITTAAVGSISGKLIGKITFELEKLSWHWMLLGLPFLGLLWGIISGGAGGIFIFIFGAIFGAILGGLVGSIALPAFAVFHRLLKRGDKIDEKHFLPIALGISMFIFVFILSS